jgi:hypothetical protein
VVLRSLLWPVPLVVHGAASCTTLPSTTWDPTTFCSQVVKYSYYLPSGGTPGEHQEGDLGRAAPAILTAFCHHMLVAAQLNALAIAQANDTAYSALPVSCQQQLKRLVCASLYMKCTVISGNAVPIRACQSLCQPLANPSTTCGRILIETGRAPNCSLLIYSTNPSTCNSATGANLNVTASQEPYVGKACKGIITTTYVPPAAEVDSSVAPMPRPYYLQGLIEETVSSALDRVPVFLTPECQNAIKLAVCGMSFLGPQNVTTPLMSSILPQYPSRAICTTLQSACASLIQSQFASTPGFSLLMDCEGRSQAGPLQFPAGPQPIATVQTASYGSLVFNTTPNALAQASVSSQVTCPLGFQVASPVDIHAGAYRTRVIKGTGCVANCQIPMYTEREYQLVDAILKTLCVVGTLGAIFIVTTLVVFQKARKQPFVLCLALSSGMLSFSQVPGVLFIEPTRRYCIGNGTPISQADGFTYCAFQGAMFQYFGLATPLFWLAMCIELYAKVVLRKKDVETWVPGLMAVGWGFPLITLIAAASGTTLGYSQPNVWCYFGKWVRPRWDMCLFYAPCGIITVAGTIIMGRVIAQIWQIAFASEAHLRSPSPAPPLARARGGGGGGGGRGAGGRGGSERESSFMRKGAMMRTASFMSIKNSMMASQKQLRMSRYPMMFVFAFLCVVYLLFTLRYIGYFYGKQFQQAFEAWIHCTFVNFVNGDPGAASKACGVVPRMVGGPPPSWERTLTEG